MQYVGKLKHENLAVIVELVWRMGHMVNSQKVISIKVIISYDIIIPFSVMTSLFQSIFTLMTIFVKLTTDHYYKQGQMFKSQQRNEKVNIFNIL